ILNFNIQDDGDYVCIASNAAGESSIIAVIRKGLKGNQFDNFKSRHVLTSFGTARITELTARQFDSSKQFHEYQLSQRLINVSFNCEQFENELLKNVKFRTDLCDKFAVEEFNKDAGKCLEELPRSPPEIVQKPKDVFCYEGDDLTFQIKVSGNPVPRIYWFKNGA